MSLNISSSNYPGLRLLVKHWLHEAVNIQAQNQYLDLPEYPILSSIYRVQPQVLSISEIPVKLDINHTEIIYVSAIAPFLEKPWGQSASKIAQRLIESLLWTTTSNKVEARFSFCHSCRRNFSLEANSSGWITFKISEQGLSQWLETLFSFFQNLTNSSDETRDWHENSQIHLRDSTALCPSLSRITHIKDIPRNSTEIWLAQHAHARCCSLLRLGRQDGLIHLEAFPRGQSIIDPLPWLGENVSLRCQHSSEQQLIKQICQNLDEISCLSYFSDPGRTLKQIDKLSQAFRCFYADCLIFNEVKVNNLALAQVRLGLVDLVRSLLQLLLEDGLGIPAPSEL